MSGSKLATALTSLALLIAPAAAQTPPPGQPSPEAIAKANADYYAKAGRDAESGSVEAFRTLFDRYLFRAGPNPDLAAAKKYGDLARKLKVVFYSARDTEKMLAAIDACYDAGRPQVPAGDKTPPGLDNNHLAELYANGWGVARNPRLALALVCHGSTVPAELFYRVEMLTATKDLPKLEKPFTVCGTITSGEHEAECTWEAEEKRVAQREADTAALIASWTPEQKTAFTALQAAGEEFWKKHSYAERDMTGTARNAIATMELSRLRDRFLASVRDFEAGKLPAHEDYAAADKELNRAYKAMIANYEAAFKKPDGLSFKPTSSVADLRETERLWLIYRDAWAAVGAARYPQAPEADWLAWATNARVKLLYTVPTWK